MPSLIPEPVMTGKGTTIKKNFSPPKIRFIPWDPTSELHVQRLITQRHHCGWKFDAVRNWIKPQVKGDIVFSWIVLDDAEKLALHTTKYEDESTPIIDTATSINGVDRVPTKESFIPVGHISLDSISPYPELGNKPAGLYSINTFYVSYALQYSGVGSASLAAIERIAVDEPFNAKTIALHTIATDFEGRDEKLKAQGRVRPRVEVQEWYERRGYKFVESIPGAWEEKDPTGKVWQCTAVLMRKELKRVEKGE